MLTLDVQVLDSACKPAHARYPVEVAAGFGRVAG